MRALALTLGLAAAASAACATTPNPAPATGVLRTADGRDAGRIDVREGPQGLVLRIEARGLTPGWHGLHFHEVGDCSKSDFTSAGGHVHGGAARVHGLLNPKANESGDLPNLYADANGAAMGEVFTTMVSLKASQGRQSLRDANGSALVIHASPDDHMTQPIGGAGARVACGVIK